VSSGIHTRGHIALHSKAGQPISMQQLIIMFFTKETLAASCAMGNERKSKNGAGHQPLNPVITQSLIGKFSLYYIIN